MGNVEDWCGRKRVAHKVRRVGAILIASAFLTLVVSCSTTVMTTRYASATIDPTAESKVFDSFVYVLAEKGFAVKLANKELGIITTEWRDFHSSGDTALLIFTGSTYNTYLMMQVSIKNDSYAITPQIRRTQSKGFGESSSSIQYPDQKSDAGKLVNEIAKEVNKMAGTTGDVVWQEKTEDLSAK